MFNFIKYKINIFDKKKNKKEPDTLDSKNPIFRYILNHAEKNSSENTIKFVKKILSLIEKRDFKKLRELCLSGLPDEIPFLRSLVWKLNLGYLPVDISEWDNTLIDKREEYNYLKKAFSMKLDLEKKIYEEKIKRQQTKNSINNVKNKQDSKEDIKVSNKRCRSFSKEFASYKESSYFLFINEKNVKKHRNKSFNVRNPCRKSVSIKINHKDSDSQEHNNNIYSKIENTIHRLSLKSTEEISNSFTKDKKEFKNNYNHKNRKYESPIENMDERPIISSKDRELIEDIYKDMRRTYSDFQFFLRPANKKANQINDKDIENIIKRRSFNVSSLGFQTVVKEMNMEETHLDVIARILFIYSKTNNELDYVQGMNEICALIYYVIVQEEDLKSNFNKATESRVKIDLNSVRKISNNKIIPECSKTSEEDVNNEDFYSLTDSNLKSNDPILKEYLNFEDFILNTENTSNLNSRSKFSKKDYFNNKHIDRDNYIKEIKGNHNYFKENYSIVLKTEVLESSINNLTNGKIEECQANLSEFLKTDFESDTYWCFSYVMDMIKYTYMKSEDNKDQGIFKKIDLLKSALKSFDPNLHKLMEEKKIDLGIFTMRWFILLFCQDFTLPDVIRIWDILLFIEEDTDIFFKVYIFGLAIISLKKDYLQKYDYVSFIIEMQNLYDINIETLIDTYTSIHKNFSKKLKKIIK